MNSIDSRFRLNKLPLAETWASIFISRQNTIRPSSHQLLHSALIHIYHLLLTVSNKYIAFRFHHPILNVKFNIIFFLSLSMFFLIFQVFDYLQL